MSLTLTERGSVAVVQVHGQLIVGNRLELKELVGSELSSGRRLFVVDFTDANYVDSSGLGVLVSVSKKIRQQGGTLCLAALNDDLRLLFELTRLDTLFRLYETPDDALRAARAE